MKVIRDSILILILAVIIGLAVNFVRNSASLGGLPLGTPWPDNRKIEALDKPPSYDPATDTLITVEEAYSLFLDKAVFIDARDHDEYIEGHIKGAINLPFESWDDYWSEVEPLLSPDTQIVVYCEGLDCELSLYAARELKSLGYKNAYTFFGGWQKWNEAGLPVEKSGDGDD